MGRSLISMLFGPKIAEKRWVEIDFNECAKTYAPSACVGDNYLLKVAEQAKLVKTVHKMAQADHTWGGYLEDRSFLWRGSYMPQEKMNHLGIDFNAPAGTWVRIPASGKTVFATHDKDQTGGWGGRVDFWVEEFGVYMIFGHLSPAAALHTPGVHFAKGCEIGWLGEATANGGWFPHLHLQLVSKAEYESHENPMDIDGYGEITKDIRSRYPNPKILTL